MPGLQNTIGQNGRLYQYIRIEYWLGATKRYIYWPERQFARALRYAATQSKRPAKWLEDQTQLLAIQLVAQGLNPKLIPKEIRKQLQGI